LSNLLALKNDIVKENDAEKNTIAKNRDSLPTNADSLQRSAIALATSMSYNNNEWRVRFGPLAI
jgi:hypothetical protein